MKFNEFVQQMNDYDKDLLDDIRFKIGEINCNAICCQDCIFCWKNGVCIKCILEELL